MQDFTQEKNNLINYFENVLGIKKIFLSEKNSVTIDSKPLIFVQDFSNYSVAEIDLTKKILAAVGLQLEEVSIVENEMANCILGFSDHPSNEVQIYSPRLLLRKPELKKIAWDKLKNLV